METTKTIKGKEVIAYKGMNSDMSCRDFQYEIGKSYKTDKVELCEIGFHACLNPKGVLKYYSEESKSRYFKVKLSGEITKCDFEDTKVAATEITILEEINIKEVIKTTEWWKNDNVLDLLYWSEDFARVQRSDGQWNFIDTKGNILLDEWFYYVSNFHEDFAKVRRSDDLYNFINKQGNIVSDKWFNDVYSFNEGFASVQRGDGKWNFIDKKGKILSEQWFKWLNNFHEDFARVQRSDGQWNFIDTKGNILLDEWLYYVSNFHEGFAGVRRSNRLYNFIDKDGNYLSDEWFIDAYDFHEGFAIVEKNNGEWCKINRTGKTNKISIGYGKGLFRYNGKW